MQGLPQSMFRLKPEAPPLAVLDVSAFFKAAMLSLFAIAVVRTAWMCDDAYITLRTVDNFVSGFGPRWNVAERVQTFTHPLWMFVLALPYYVTREAYFTPLVVSMLASLAAMWLFVSRIAVSSATAIIGASVLTFSRAFVEFSTSGLENPLTHVLLAMFFVLYWHPDRARRVTLLWLVASLIMMNRLDAGLLVLPAMLVRTYQMGWRPGVKAVAIGVIPIVIWEVFSVIYYGFPFPNTAYAKLSNGVPSGELTSQGIAFLLNSAANDPLTLLAMGTFVSVALASNARVSWPLALGIVLYVTYVVRVGGDFMSGRFLTAPLFAAVALFARLQVPWTSFFTSVVTATIFCLGVFATTRPPLTNRDGLVNPPRGPGIAGISDQRAFYYRYTGLLRWTREMPLPNYVWEAQGRRARLKPGVVEKGAVGMFGYFGGPKVHIVDFFALGDPLLARLPSRGRWRIGHYRRSVPRGYSESIRTGRNVIRDPELAMKYEQLKIITQDPLWTRRRWEAIIAMNTGSQRP
jgi:arabinofuranosyltransferase